MWSGVLISLRIFRFFVIHTVKGFGVVSEAETVFWFFFFFLIALLFYDPADVCNLISDSSAFSKSSLHIWKFLPHITEA